MLKTAKWVKHVFLWGIFLIILGFVIYNSFINVKVSDSPADEVYGLPNFGMTNVGEGATASKSQLELALAHCESAPQLKDSPRFQYLLGTPTGKVKLSPNDVLMLYLYSGTAETVEDTKDSYSGQAIGIIMHTDDPNGIGYGMATTENQTINENPSGD